MSPPKDPLKYIEYIRKLSEAQKGKQSPFKGKFGYPSPLKGKKIKPTFLGKHHKESSKEKVRGKNHYRYCGGKKISRRKQNYKRKGLGYIPINEYFEGSEGHHLNIICVLFIPKTLHKMLRHNVWNGHNMEEMNDLAIKWYFSYE